MTTDASSDAGSALATLDVFVVPDLRGVVRWASCRGPRITTRRLTLSDWLAAGWILSGAASTRARDCVEVTVRKQAADEARFDSVLLDVSGAAPAGLVRGVVGASVRLSEGERLDGWLRAGWSFLRSATCAGGPETGRLLYALVRPAGGSELLPPGPGEGEPAPGAAQ